MTSPQAATTDVVAAMATTAIVDDNSPSLELTADEEPAGDLDANLELEHKEPSETIPPEERKDMEMVGDNAGGEQHHKEVIRGPEDAAIPDLSHDSHPGFQSVTDPAQRAGLDALMAMGFYGYDINGLQLPQASAHGLPALPMAIDGRVGAHPYLDPSPYIPEVDETRISAYAKLEFEDGEFYMNTYSVILGRDLAAARAAMRRDQEEEKRRIELEISGPITPVQVKREESRYSKSVISESGGILREGDDLDGEERARRRQSRKASKKSKSTGSSHHLSRRNSLVLPNGQVTYEAQSQTKLLALDTDGVVPVDPGSLRPDPHECPLVGIHPPAVTPASGYKAISRRHVKIAYNSKKYLFEAHIFGRNGAFVDEEFYYHNDVVELKSGSRLQIGGVVVRFVLPDVAIGETGAEQRPEYDENVVADRYSEGGKEMSFDFEEEPRNGAVLEDTSEDLSDVEQRGEGEELDEDEEDEDGEGPDDEEPEASDQSGQGEGDEEDEEDGNEDQQNPPDFHHRPEKKRGPGRPPKNGIMSKREQQLAKKEALAQQRAQKTLPQTASVAPTGKNKVGRPRKHPRPDTPPIKTEKRKYTKRKPKEPKDGEVKQEGSGGEDQPAKEKKEKKPPKPPRSPSPQFNEADLSPEQLAKPQANYVTLIHEALSNSPTGQMSLPQIYRAIQRKYPFFVLKCSTNGWQSSVRHNLSQHHAFKKIERDGKGWMWGIVEGVSIEKEKKRRTPPPPQLPPGHMHHQPIYQAGHPPNMIHGHPYGPGIMGPPPGYMMNPQMSPNTRHGQPPPYMGPPPPMNGHPPPPGFQPPNGSRASGYTVAITPQLAGPSSNTYSSPYAPKPVSSVAPQPTEPQPPTDYRPSTQGPPPPVTPQQALSNPPPGPPQPNEAVLRGIEVFKGSLMRTLKEKSTNAEEIFASAVNQVLGVTSQSTIPGNPHEEQIMKALRSLLEKIPGSNMKPSSVAPTNLATHAQQSNGQLPLQSQNTQNGTKASITQQPAKSAGPEKPAPAVMRPTFTGQGQSRPNGPSVPRPSMLTPSMKRTNSGSPANPAPRPAQSSASPASTPTTGTNGTGTPKLPVAENGQLAGQKRPHDDADDMREFKRMSASGPPQLKT